MIVQSYLNFDGNCRAAIAFYEKAMGATVLFSMTWGDSPMCDNVPSDWSDKVMHTALRVGESTVMACDAPPGRYQKPQGLTVSLGSLELDEARTIFNALAEGGAVSVPFAETFWAKGFGMVVDKFGIPWMVNCEKPMP